jgi:hypothetical protein
MAAEFDDQLAKKGEIVDNIVHPLKQSSLSKDGNGRMERMGRRHTSLRATVSSFEIQ